jgi:dihydrofolate synthase/folylpolyglutamate synthase
MTVGMAFWYFDKQKVDYAVVEVGMGGRFDSTNILKPILCLITNIGLDHVQFLGNTLPEIASEKAGIIKENVPVVISQTQEVTKAVFLNKANSVDAPIFFAEDSYKNEKVQSQSDGLLSHFRVENEGQSHIYKMDLKGNYQTKNLGGVLKAVEILRNTGIDISSQSLKTGLQKIVANTGLKGRWQILQEEPKIICDTGHNEDGIKFIVDQIQENSYNQLFIIIGVVNDKDISKILSLLPKKAKYFFCQANIPRAMPAIQLFEKAKEFGLEGIVVEDVNEAIDKAKYLAEKNDLIFVGGSTFVVAEIKDL